MQSNMPAEDLDLEQCACDACRRFVGFLSSALPSVFNSFLASGRGFPLDFGEAIVQLLPRQFWLRCWLHDDDDDDDDDDDE